MPIERTRAVERANEFLYKIGYERGRKSLKELKEEARSILRHYPSLCDLYNGTINPHGIWDAKYLDDELNKKYPKNENGI